MKTTDRTILITGGGSGIGRGLAEAFHALGNRVIISGRSEGKLAGVTAENPGMAFLTVDISDAGSIASFAAKLASEHPALDVLVNCAGVMRPENILAEPADLKDAEEIIETNLLGPLRLTKALLPALMKRPHAVIMNVSSGLAFLPMATTPTYCATKAAIHSYTQSLRYQLEETDVEVLELIPPYVATGLMGDTQANDPRAMPLKEFIEEVMAILQNEPDATENLCEEGVSAPVRRRAGAGEVR